MLETLKSKPLIPTSRLILSLEMMSPSSHFLCFLCITQTTIWAQWIYTSSNEHITNVCTFCRLNQWVVNLVVVFIPFDLLHGIISYSLEKITAEIEIIPFPCLYYGWKWPSVKLGQINTIFNRFWLGNPLLLPSAVHHLLVHMQLEPIFH